MEFRRRRADELDTLLARGRMSGAHHDDVLHHVLDEVAPKRRLRWLYVAVPAVSAALALVVAWPKGGELAVDDFRAKGRASGTALANPLHIEVACDKEGGRRGSCLQGGRLVFTVEGAGEGGYLHAWAEPRSGASGEHVWYFEGDTAQKLAVSPECQTLPVAVRLGPEQTPGSWIVYAVVEPEALGRERVLGAPPPLRVPLEVLEPASVDSAHVDAAPTASVLRPGSSPRSDAPRPGAPGPGDAAPSNSGSGAP